MRAVWRVQQGVRVGAATGNGWRPCHAARQPCTPLPWSSAPRSQPRPVRPPSPAPRTWRLVGQAHAHGQAIELIIEQQVGHLRVLHAGGHGCALDSAGPVPWHAPRRPPGRPWPPAPELERQLLVP